MILIVFFILLGVLAVKWEANALGLPLAAAAYWFAGMAEAFVPSSLPVETLKRLGKVTLYYWLGFVSGFILFLAGVEMAL